MRMLQDESVHIITKTIKDNLGDEVDFVCVILEPDEAPITITTLNPDMLLEVYNFMANNTVASRRLIDEERGSIQ